MPLTPLTEADLLVAYKQDLANSIRDGEIALARFYWEEAAEKFARAQTIIEKHIIPLTEKLDQGPWLRNQSACYSPMATIVFLATEVEHLAGLIGHSSSSEEAKRQLLLGVGDIQKGDLRRLRARLEEAIPLYDDEHFNDEIRKLIEHIDFRRNEDRADLPYSIRL